MNNVVLIGRCVADPELKFIPGSGQAVAKFTLAIDKQLSREKKAEFESQGKPTADFPRVIVWGKQAENCAQYLAKGRMVAINGSIQTGSYKSNSGETHYTTDILANNVQFLEWGDAKEKVEKKADDDFSFGANSFEDFQTIEDDDDVPF